MAKIQRKRYKVETSQRIQKKHSQAKRKQNQQSTRPKAHQPTQQKSTIPFQLGDRILLIGEGDFSFAHSLLQNYSSHFSALLATTLETRGQLLAKHPQAEAYTKALSSRPIADEPKSFTANSCIRREDPLIDAGVDYEDQDVDADDDTEQTGKECGVLYSVDGTKLSKHKQISKCKWNRIVFNFPHVGGKSTDVNRQVRHNQELIHGFLRSALPLLAWPGGTVLITLFEGEPYTLWNVRDIARSVGLNVLRSFRFDATTYPGYRHARTLGNLKGDDEGEWLCTDGHVGDMGGRRGRWRGESRNARTFEFGLSMKEEGGPRDSKERRRDNAGSSEDDY